MWVRALSLAMLAAAVLAAQDQADDVDQAPTAATLVVTGSVELSSPDGPQALPSDIRIAVDCKGEFIDGGGVSPAGQFRFTMTPNPIMIAGSTICGVEAKVFGYDSTREKFGVRANNGVASAGTITLTRNSAGDAQEKSGVRGGATVSATSLKAPAKAVKQFEEGKQLLRRKKPEDAARSFEAAIRIYPEYADAWMNLGLLAVQGSDLLTAARDLDESLRVDAGVSFQACYSDALVNLMLKRYDVAERSARQALRYGDGGANARINYVLGMSLLARGGNVEARQRLTRYLELAPGAPEREQVERELGRLDRIDPAAPVGKWAGPLR
jgi:tetratricopeptide (TPR) repeat protein